MGTDSREARLPVPRALVFDMDGLLLDTERPALDGFVRACRAVGAQPNLDVYRRCIGRRMRESRRILLAGHGPSFPLDEVLAAWESDYAERVAAAPPAVKPGAKALLAMARTLRLPCAVATSSRQPGAGERLAAAGLAGYFTVWATGDRVTRSKPDPETYRLAVAELGVAPAEAWALEDSANGVCAAHAAGCQIVQIPDLVPPDAALLALGHTVLPSLGAVEGLLRQCVARRQLGAGAGCKGRQAVGGGSVSGIVFPESGPPVDSG